MKKSRALYHHGLACPVDTFDDGTMCEWQGLTMPCYVANIMAYNQCFAPYVLEYIDCNNNC